MMVKNGILIDTQKYTIKEIQYNDTTIDDLFYKVVGEQYPTPSAYIFPIESKLAVEDLLQQLKTAKKTYDDFVAAVYYKEFPKLR